MSTNLVTLQGATGTVMETANSLPSIDWEQAKPEVLLERIAEAKVVGMGGAGFPTAEKLAIAQKNSPNVVIANGMETDPGVSADKVLLKQKLHAVLTGLRVVARILTATKSYIAVSEQNIAQDVQSALNRDEIVQYIKPTFQNGAERELIQILTGHVVTKCEYPATYGCVVLNVHTLFAISEAIAGKLLTKRLVTIKEETRWVDLDTTIDSVLDGVVPVRVGCYATGHRPTKNEPLTAKVNAISIDKSVHALPCIHCGWCDQACPLDIPVEKLYLISEQQTPNLASQDALNRCNDCGACVVACPSNIHLLDHVRALRKLNKREKERKLRADQARARVEARAQRLRSNAIKVDTSRAERMQQQHKWQ